MWFYANIQNNSEIIKLLATVCRNYPQRTQGDSYNAVSVIYNAVTK